MKKIIRLTESDLTRIVRRVITENSVPHFELYNCLIKKWKGKGSWEKSSGSLDSGDKVTYTYIYENVYKPIKCRENIEDFMLNTPVLSFIYSNFIGLESPKYEGYYAVMECIRENGVIRCNVKGHKLTESEICDYMPDSVQTVRASSNITFTFNGNGVNMNCEQLTNKLTSFFK